MNGFKEQSYSHQEESNRHAWHRGTVVFIPWKLNSLMESQAGRKRPREGSSSVDLHVKRQGSTIASSAASSSRYASPLPHKLSSYPCDGRILGQRILPPLRTLFHSTSTGAPTPSTGQLSAHARHPSADSYRPRSQSLFNVFQHHHWRDRNIYTGMHALLGQ
jgi:hypothetical protein